MAERKKKIRHMGMAMTEEEHERWHKRHSELTPEHHEALMKKMGVSKEEDEKWHRKHEMPPEAGESEQKPINPYAIGGGFLDYCVKQGWLIREGKARSSRYYATKKGREELKKFGIDV